MQYGRWACSTDDGLALQWSSSVVRRDAIGPRCLRVIGGVGEWKNYDHRDSHGDRTQLLVRIESNRPKNMNVGLAQVADSK